MNPLTIHDIEELDRRIDAAVPPQPLLSLNRDVALIHLLRYHESYMVGNASTPHRGERENATKHAYDGMNHAVQWIFQFCTPSLGATPLTFDEETYLEAERSYLPKPGVHFDTIDASVEFGGITFKLDGLACLPKTPWKPDIDIRIPV